MGRSALSDRMSKHSSELHGGARVYINAPPDLPLRYSELSEIAIDSVELLSALIANGEACKNWLAGDRPNLDRVRATVVRMIRDARTLSDLIQGGRGESNPER